MKRIVTLLISLALMAAGAFAQEFGPWSKPVNLGGVVNSTANDQHPTISKDGLTLIFASDRPGGFGDFDLWVTERDSLDADSAWSTPQNLTMLNSPGRDFAPYLTTDGHWLFFHSNRPGGCGGMDLYASHRQNKRDDFGWEPPINLGCTINTVADDAGPALFEDDTTGTIYLYFTRNLTPTNPAGYDIYLSTCTSDLDSCIRQQLWTPASIVPELSSPARDTRTAIRRRDGLEMIISSGRIGGVGNEDLWVSTRASVQDPWSIPVNIDSDVTQPVVNSTFFDGAPALSWDGQTLIFFSQRPGGFGASDLYMSTRQKITGQE